MNKYLLVGILAILVIAGGWRYLNQSNVPSASETAQFPTQENTNTGTQTAVNNQTAQQPQTNTQTQTATQSNTKTFRSENGFQFQYPSAWTVTGVEQTGTSYQVLARVVNPARAGRPDTDVPIEQFLVRRMNVPCQGSATTFAGKTGYSTEWAVDFGISSRNICIPQGNDWAIHISGSAADQASRASMDAIFASFAFIQ